MIVNEVLSTGISVVPGFLSSQEVSVLVTEMDALRAHGHFRPARIGKKDTQPDLEQTREVRRDETCWLDPADPTAAQKTLWKKLGHLRETFNREAFLGLCDFEGHYAFYEPGAFYRRHLDAFKTDDARAISTVLYLNEDWNTRDGGELRAYLTDGRTLEVAPIGGTLVCFLSRELEHEVAESRGLRRSFTGWFKTRSAKPA